MNRSLWELIKTLLMGAHQRLWWMCRHSTVKISWSKTFSRIQIFSKKLMLVMKITKKKTTRTKATLRERSSVVSRPWLMQQWQLRWTQSITRTNSSLASKIHGAVLPVALTAKFQKRIWMLTRNRTMADSVKGPKVARTVVKPLVENPCAQKRWRVASKA